MRAAKHVSVVAIVTLAILLAGLALVTGYEVYLSHIVTDCGAGCDARVVQGGF